MPHFIIECSAPLLENQNPKQIMANVYHAAFSTGLFASEGPGRIKVRISPFQHYTTAGEQEDFIHVFGYIMEGRTEEQKMALSQSVVAALAALFPDAPIISMNISEFEKSSYVNKSMI